MTTLPDGVSVGLAEHLVQTQGTFRLIKNTSHGDTPRKRKLNEA